MSKIQFSVQVRLVSDLTRSKQFYEEVLGCEVNDVWAVRDDFALGFKLIQAESRADVTPNPAGKDHATRWDTYAYVGTHYDLDALYEELTSRGRSGTGTCIHGSGLGRVEGFCDSRSRRLHNGFGSGIKD